MPYPPKSFPQILLVLAVLGMSSGCGGASDAPRSTRPNQAKKPPPKVKRALSPEQLQRTMKQRSTELAACYELSPAREKQLGGELTLDFTVEASGKVSGESLMSDSIADKVLADCVVGVVRETAFPRSEAAIDVSWPMHFGPR